MKPMNPGAIGFVVIHGDEVLTYDGIRRSTAAANIQVNISEAVYLSGNIGINGFLFLDVMNSSLMKWIKEEEMYVAAVNTPVFTDGRLAMEPEAKLAVDVEGGDEFVINLSRKGTFTSMDLDGEGDVTVYGKFSVGMYDYHYAELPDLEAVWDHLYHHEELAPAPSAIPMPSVEEVRRALEFQTLPPSVDPAFDAAAFERAFSQTPKVPTPPGLSYTESELRIQELERELAAHRQAHAASTPWTQATTPGPELAKKATESARSGTGSAEVMASLVDDMFGFLTR